MRQLVILLIIVFLIQFYFDRYSEPSKRSPAGREVQDKKSSPVDSQRAERDNFIAGRNKQVK
jgi:hypothetical protein